jgi:hypothetical protein
MSLKHVLLTAVVFILVFLAAGKWLKGWARQAVQWLAGAIIVVVLAVYLLGLLGLW